jgi:hypothetical protein
VRSAELLISRADGTTRVQELRDVGYAGDDGAGDNENDGDDPPR